MPEKGFIIDVAPLTRLPLGRQQFFSYIYPTPIPAGSLVSIPLFRREVQGIVLGSRTDFHRLGNFELKKVSRITIEALLTDIQLKIAEFISEYYFAPLGIVFKSFIPKIVKARKISVPEIGPARKIKLTEPQLSAVENILTGPLPKSLLFGPAASGKTEIYLECIRRTRKSDRQAQFLVLLPELGLTPQIIERLGSAFNPEEVAILTSETSKGEFYTNWEAIRSGQKKLIIGTRLAVFAPYANLKLIVVDEEQDMSHKQWDMTPRYHARTVAEKIAELSGARLILGSATPAIETYYRATEKKELQLVEIPRFVESLPRITLADMRKERWAKNPGILSRQLVSEIGFVLKHGLQAVIFVNRRGMSSFTVCAACKTVLKCPQCERAAVLDRSGYYRCLHCNYHSDIFPRCTKCQGLEFKNIGFGTQKVEREIAKKFPGARIARADSDSTRERSGLEKIYRSFKSGQIDILVGTQMITKGWDLPAVGLIGIIDADNLLDWPDFSADERALGHLMQVSGRTARPGSRVPGQVIIQTFRPENSVIRLAVALDWKGFYQNELENRRSLGFPPFSRIINLIFRDVTREAAAKKAETFFRKVKDIRNTEFSVSPPHSPLLDNIRGHYRSQVTLKVSQGELPAELAREINKLDSECLIDVDPVSIS